MKFVVGRLLMAIFIFSISFFPLKYTFDDEGKKELKAALLMILRKKNYSISCSCKC